MAENKCGCGDEVNHDPPCGDECKVKNPCPCKCHDPGWFCTNCECAMDDEQPQEKPAPVGEAQGTQPLRQWDRSPFTDQEIEEYMMQESAPQVDRIKATIRALEAELSAYRGYPHPLDKYGLTSMRNRAIKAEAENKELRAIIDDPDTNPAYNSCGCRFDAGEIKQECKTHQDLRMERDELSAQVGVLVEEITEIRESADENRSIWHMADKALSNLPETARKEMERVKVLEAKVTAALDMGMAVGESHKKLEAKNTRLRELLEPFAKMGERYTHDPHLKNYLDGDLSKVTGSRDGVASTCLRFGDFRDAFAALHPEEES